MNNLQSNYLIAQSQWRSACRENINPAPALVKLESAEDKLIAWAEAIFASLPSQEPALSVLFAKLGNPRYREGLLDIIAKMELSQSLE